MSIQHKRSVQLAGAGDLLVLGSLGTPGARLTTFLLGRRRSFLASACRQNDCLVTEGLRAASVSKAPVAIMYIQSEPGSQHRAHTPHREDVPVWAALNFMDLYLNLTAFLTNLKDSFIAKRI